MYEGRDEYGHKIRSSRWTPVNIMSVALLLGLVACTVWTVFSQLYG